MSQESYIEQNTKIWFMYGKMSKVLLDTGYFRLVKSRNGMNNNDKFQKLIGPLLYYIVTHKRPDVVASVSILRQHIKQPTERYWNEAKRVVRYLKGTQHLKLGNNGTGLIVYSDAHWAEDQNYSNSHSDYVL